MRSPAPAATTRRFGGVPPAAWIAPILLLCGGAAFVAFGVTSAASERDAAVRDARAGLGTRVEGEVAKAAERLRAIVADTRERGVFKDVPFPLDVRSVAWTPAAAPRRGEFAEAERLEFEAHDPRGALAEVRRIGADAPPGVAARALRDESRLLTGLGLAEDAVVALRRVVDMAGAPEREVLLAREALARDGDPRDREILRADLVAGRFGAAAPVERLVLLRDLGGDASETAPLAALVALEDAADPSAVVVAGAAHVAWQLDRSADAVRVAVAPLAEFAAGLVPSAAEGLVVPVAAPRAPATRPFPALRFEPTAIAAASFDRAGADAARRRLVPSLALALALAAGAAFTLRAARLRSDLETRKDAFLCAVTHELKTPIANVLLYAETLNAHGSADPAVIPKFTATIASEAMRLEARVAEILDVASGRSGVPRGDERFDAAAAVREVAAEFGERAAGRGVVLDAGVGADPAFVRGSPRMLRRALAAVIDNAILFAPGGAVRVAASRESGRVRIVVEDEGPGVAAPDRDRVFEPFVRLGDERTRAVPGTGLGLTLARQGVESCGGAIRCEAREPRGARFVFEIPEA